MEIDPAPMLENLFLYLFESKYVQQSTSKGSAYNFDRTSRFIDDLCTIIDDDDFSSSYEYIYSKQLGLKLEHQSKHATLLDLYIIIEDNVFVYKLFDKRDKSSFFILCMPYLSHILKWQNKVEIRQVSYRR